MFNFSFNSSAKTRNPLAKPAKGKLAKMEATPAEGSSLFFPSDIKQLDHYVAFRISRDVKFRRDSISRSEAGTTIFLPMPSNLSTAYKASYANEGLGPLAGAAAEQGGNIRALVEGKMNQNQFAASLVDMFGSEESKQKIKSGLLNAAALSAEGEVGGLIGGALGGIGGAAAGAAAAGGLKAGMAGAGIARNPHMATMFEGLDFRSHSFQYKFVPRNKKESDALRDIIYKFKYHMSPSYAAEGHFFNYPEQFDIEFNHKDYLFDVGASVLTGFDVSYTGENGSFFFDNNGAPVSVTISMVFQELTLVTKDRIEKGR